MAHAGSHTGQALRDYETALARTAAARRRSRPRRRAATPRRRTPSRSTTPASTTCKNIDVEIPRNRFTVITGVSGSRQVHARLRHPVRRGPAALPRVAQRLRAPVRAARVAAGRGRDLRHPAHGGDRAAHQPRRPQEHGRHAHRDLPLPAPALREARHAALPGLRRADRAAERGRHRRAHPEGLPRPAHRPARAAGRQPQGLLHRPRQVGARQGLRAPARGRRASCRPRPLAAPRPLQGAHASSCRSPTCASRRRTKRSCATALATALELGKGVVHVLAAAEARGVRGATATLARRSSRPSAPARPAARSFAELDPRLFSFNSQARLVPDLLRHRA